MSDDNEMVLWGTIRAWSNKLAIPEDVLKERFKNLPSQPCRARRPNDPTGKIMADAFAEPDVLEACADLLRPGIVDTDGRLANEIREEIKDEGDGP